ncbi:TPM domain-containing protein [Actinotalea sp. Marseille-Q4924]|uniref:TPM domain-containing protein n=1 Tax=Actinotalea sp. Marseille-Q4924 TaxID=2866571 RepID=UPI001CE48533|nr:TPM domain-containing protein [Actinotalea sp. Marseille-Q4924]
MTPARTRARTVPARAATALTGAALLTLGPALAAGAAEPIDLTEQVVDEAGVLGGQAAEVQEAVDRLATDAGIDLYVVFVEDFSGRTYTEWGQETAELSGLGGRDTLLAVAVGDRDYFFGAAEGSPARAAISEIEPQVRSELSANDWAGAALAAATGLREASTGTGTGADPGSPPGAPAVDDGGGLGGFVTLLLLGGAVIAGVLLVRSLRRKRSGPADGRGPGGPPAPVAQGLEALPTDELDRRAASALVRVDDAVRTSEQELGFAQAQFGIEATREFGAVLERAKKQVLEAFHLRQVLEDEIPDDDATVRRVSLQVLALCREVAESLDSQTDKFDELRDLQKRAPELLDADEARAAEIEGRIPAARRALEQLAATYPQEALASVTANPDQAQALLDQVRVSVGQGREALAAGDRAAAVDLARASENAIGQAVTLLDAVDRAGSDLASAAQRLERAIASISSDIDDARRLAPRSGEVAPRVDTARVAIERAQAARSGGDPLAALRTITEAEAELDRALAPHREEAERRSRAEQHLGETLGRVDSLIRATADFITTRRGAVGPDARTRLAEAARLLQLAGDQARTDPETALATVQRAESLAQEAQAIAHADIDDYELRHQPRTQYHGGPNVGGMILGGILIDSIPAAAAVGRRLRRRLRGGGGGGFGGAAADSAAASAEAASVEGAAASRRQDA